MQRQHAHQTVSQFDDETALQKIVSAMDSSHKSYCLLLLSWKRQDEHILLLFLLESIYKIKHGNVKFYLAKGFHAGWGQNGISSGRERNLE